jgi:nitrite reductase/ring-hydroxylating ferredoxin subunit
MMRARQAFLDRREDEKEPTPPPQRLALGHWDDLRSRLPLLISAGERDYRLVAQGAEVVAHSTVCPHMGGPLEASEIIDGSIVCLWHGYRFSLGDGRAAEGRPCRLEEAPRVERDRNGMAQLVFDSGSI